MLPPNGGVISGSQRRVGMVSARNARVQWGSIDDAYSGYGDRVKFFSPWLGSTQWGLGRLCWWPVLQSHMLIWNQAF